MSTSSQGNTIQNREAEAKKREKVYSGWQIIAATIITLIALLSTLLTTETMFVLTILTTIMLTILAALGVAKHTKNSDYNNENNHILAFYYILFFASLTFPLLIAFLAEGSDSLLFLYGSSGLLAISGAIIIAFLAIEGFADNQHWGELVFPALMITGLELALFINPLFFIITATSSLAWVKVSPSKTLWPVSIKEGMHPNTHSSFVAATTASQPSYSNTFPNALNKPLDQWPKDGKGLIRLLEEINIPPEDRNLIANFAKCVCSNDYGSLSAASRIRLASLIRDQYLDDLTVVKKLLEKHGADTDKIFTKEVIQRFMDLSGQTIIEAPTHAPSS